MRIAPESTDVVILCGGLGTRLRERVSDRPKPMADIKQTPFVQILIEQFGAFGFRRFILCTGYMSEVVKSHFREYAGNAEIVVSEEAQPLGTAGAIRHARDFIQSDPFLVTNGDSYCSVPLDSFCEFHTARAAEMSMVVTTTDQSEDYGSVGIDQTGRITSFQEKAGGMQSGLINAGIYLLQKHIFRYIPPAATCSLELDVFPRLMGRCCYAYVNAAPVFDIGTPERLARAEDYFARLCRKTPSSARERAIFSPDKDGEAGDVCLIVDAAGCRQAEKGPLEARSGLPTEPGANVT